MSAKDSQSYNSQQPQWAGHQPAYIYPQRRPEDGPYLDPQILTSHDQASDMTSFDYGPTYNQISRSSTLIPSHGQYPHSETSQVPYTSYPDLGYSDHQQSHHDYFRGSQHAFERVAPAMPDSSVPAYTSPPFPHQFSELSQACNFGARDPLPTVNGPDGSTPAFSEFDVASHHGQNTGSNKRQRSEEEDGDPNSQAHGDNTAADKSKRACARCRGLKVCPLTHANN
jgi:hypothetical protein